MDPTQNRSASPDAIRISIEWRHAGRRKQLVTGSSSNTLPEIGDEMLIESMRDGRIRGRVVDRVVTYCQTSKVTEVVVIIE